MSRFFFGIVAALSVFLQSAGAFAGVEQFKDAIWKDCQTAKSEASGFDSNARSTSVEFLKGIISLDLSTPIEPPLVNPEIIKAPEGIQGDVSFAQSLDPEKFNRAKKCTAEILPLLVPESSVVLPELLIQSEDSRIDSEVSAAFSRAAYKLAQRLALPIDSEQKASKNLNIQIPDALMNQLFEIYIKSHSTLSEEIITLFPSQLIKLICARLLVSTCNLDCTQEQELARLLSTLDVSFSSHREELVNLITNARSELRILILEALQYSTPAYEVLLRFIIPRLQSSIEPERSRFFQNLNSIFNFELRSASLALNPKERLSLLDSFESSNRLQRDILEKGLMVIAPLYPEFTSHIKSLVNSTDADLRSRAARLLSHVRLPTAETKKLFANLLADKVVDVQLVALESSLSRNDPQQVLADAANIYNKLVKSKEPQDTEPSQKFERMIYLLRTVSQISVQSLPALWTKVALEATEIGLILERSQPEIAPAVSILLMNPKKSFNDLRSFARSSETSKKNTAIYIIRQGFIPENSVFDTLLSLTSDPDPTVSKNAQLGLLTLAPELKELISARRNLAPSPRLNELLLETGIEPQLETEVQREVQTVGCSEISELANACLARATSGKFCSLIVSQIPRCVDQGILEKLPQGIVEKAINLQSQIKHLFLQSFYDPKTENLGQLQIGLFLLRAKVGDQTVISRLCELAEIASDSALKEIVSYASTTPQFSENCLKILKKQFENVTVTSSKKAQLFKYIVKLDPAAINVPIMLKDALERHELEFLRVLSEAEMVNDLLPLLSQVLSESNSSSNQQERLIALQLLEELGEKAISQFPVVLPLLDSQHNEVRYRAARVIIACSADHDASLKALRSILTSSDFRDLLLDPNIKGLAALVEELLHDRSANLSPLERQNLLRLLRVQRGPDASIPEALIPDGVLPESAVPVFQTPMAH